jgi:hypothetical protein
MARTPIVNAHRPAGNSSVLEVNRKNAADPSDPISSARPVTYCACSEISPILYSDSLDILVDIGVPAEKEVIQ